jgi:PPOX class probable F420-dependent enzyme
VKLSDDEARRLLGGSRVARLGTADPGGRPHLVPVTFVLDGDAVYIAIDHKPKTTVNLKRLRNIARNPSVSVLADHYEEDWSMLWWARADGRATVLEPGGEASERPVDLLVAKYEQYKEARPAGPVIVIEVTSWTGWASSARAAG